MTAMDDADWISREDATVWLRHEYQLSEGAAQAALQTALDSNNVRCRELYGQNDWISGSATDLRDLRRNPIALIKLIASVPRHVEISRADLQWQIRRQDLPSSTAASPSGIRADREVKRTSKPAQEELNRALLGLAEKRGGKLKQGDDEAREILEAMGATTRQMTEAFRRLPEQYAYQRGRPEESSA